ncbi:hypothetical protein [Streptomyces sp. WAC 04229]|uniref:hypothetical protein n=1 Tax=Streptomyces sp. WAC 04229 TaxID=2203206 RepID=UPI003D74998A
MKLAWGHAHIPAPARTPLARLAARRTPPPRAARRATTTALVMSVMIVVTGGRAREVQRSRRPTRKYGRGAHSPLCEHCDARAVERWGRTLRSG